MLIRVEDSGKGFDYSNHNIPDKETHTGLSGRGIMLISDLCESISYMGKGNIVEAIYSWNTGQ